MKTSLDLTKKIFDFLNENSIYAVLRNYVGLPINNTGRDIDVLIEEKQFFLIENQFLKIITDSNFKIITRYRSEKMIAYVCAQVIDDITEFVQFDFLFETSLYGILLIEAKDVLATRLFNGNVYYVSKEYEFLDKYLWLKLLGEPYPQKYSFIRGKMNNNQSLSLILTSLANCSNLEEMEKLSSLHLKWKILYKNLRNRPIEQLLKFILFIFFYLKNLMFYKGFSIGFTGPDGSGKTTVINSIVAEFSKVYSTIELFHFRPHLIPNLGEAAHKTKLKSEVDIDFSNPHRGGKTGIVSSFIRLLYYSIDYVLGYFVKVRSILKNRYIVIFDRYFTDIIADSRRSSIFLNLKFLFWFRKLFIPSLDFNILLTANPETILARKQELTAEGIQNINKKLNYLSNKKGYYLIVNNGTAKEATQKILTIIFEEQHKKNIKRIGH